MMLHASRGPGRDNLDPLIAAALCWFHLRELTPSCCTRRNRRFAPPLAASFWSPLKAMAARFASAIQTLQDLSVCSFWNVLSDAMLWSFFCACARTAGGSYPGQRTKKRLFFAAASSFVEETARLGREGSHQHPRPLELFRQLVDVRSGGPGYLMNICLVAVLQSQIWAPQVGLS